MLSNPTAGRRLTGRMMVLAGIAVALPLTATRAIEYIDIPMVSASAPAAKPALAPVAAVQALQSAPAVAPVAPAPAVPPVKPLIINEDGVVNYNGHEKKWKDLTAAEKAEVRRSIADARRELQRANSEEIQRNVREAMEEARMNQDEFRREMAEARADIADAMREIDAHSAELRRAGQDPEQIKATVRASLKSVEAIDVEKITRDAMKSVDPAVIEAAMRSAEAGLRQAEAQLDRLDQANGNDD